MIALDTNLLVYAQRSDVPQHRRTQKVIERGLALGMGVTSQAVAEFWSVITSAAISKRPTTPREAGAYLGALFAAGLQVLLPDAGFAASLHQHAMEHAVTGRRIHDLAIAITARENGARELWTDDAAFVRIDGLKLKFPLLG